MHKIWIVLALLAGCSNEVETAGNRMQPADRSAGLSRRATPPALKNLGGLYESSGNPANQMCVVQRGAELSFGLVVWGGNNHSCSGSGTISRSGAQVELVMEGDSPCTMDGTISGKTIRLSDSQPAGCSYYCGARARLAGVALTQTGSTVDDALKARDLVGEPLCSSM